MTDDSLSNLLRVAEAELVKLFASLLAATRRFLRGVRGAIFLPRHGVRVAGIVLLGMRALTGTSPSAQFPRGGGVPKAPLPALVRGVVRASAGLVLPGEAERAAAWAEARTWRAPDGKTLSQRLWRNGQQIRRRVDETVTRSVGAGLSPDETWDRVEGLLIGTAGRDAGPGALRRLIVTEGTRAHGVATIAAATRAEQSVRWVTTGGHAKSDECDQKARANRYGLGEGVYPASRVPEFPSHPFCKCRLVLVGGSV